MQYEACADVRILLVLGIEGTLLSTLLLVNFIWCVSRKTDKIWAVCNASGQ